MKGFTCILLTLLLILQAGIAGAATRAANSRVAAPLQRADLLLRDPGWQTAAAGNVDLEFAAEAGEATSVVLAPAQLGLAISQQLTIGLDFRPSATDEQLAQIISDFDVVDSVIDHLMLGFHCKF